MRGNHHERARELALAARIEEIGGAERQWLNAHLEDCDACAQFAAALQDAVGAVRMPAVTASSTLVTATQRRVRARASEMREHEAAMRPLWIAVAMVCAWATLTTPLVWAAFAWVGAALRLSALEWRVMFFFAWMVPTLAASLVLLGSGWRPHFAFGRLGEAE